MQGIEFAEVWKQPEQCVGRETLFRGRVIVCGSDSYIAANYEDFRLGKKAFLNDSGLISQRLLSALEPYGGGDCIYDEDILIRGKLAWTNGVYIVDAIQFCLVKRDELEIKI